MNPDPTQQEAGLMGKEPADLGSCVAGLVKTLAKETADLVAAHGLIPLDFALLRLFVGKEQWTTTELAEMLLVKTSRISRVVAKLVGMGLMRRRRPRNDRRVLFLTLTEEGKALTLELHRRVQHCEAKLSEGVSEEEMAVFASVTSTVMANHSALKRRREP